MFEFENLARAEESEETQENQKPVNEQSQEPNLTTPEESVEESVESAPAETTETVQKSRAEYFRAYRAQQKVQSIEQDKKLRELENRDKTLQLQERANREKEIRSNAARLKVALTPTIELVADAVHTLTLQPEDPSFGTQRSQVVAHQWAEVFAPYLDESSLEYLLPIMAVTVTGGQITSWVKEIREARQNPQTESTYKTKDYIDAA